MAVKTANTTNKNIQKNLQPPYKIAVDLEAFFDHMKRLRGLNALGKYYDGFSSDQLSRLPFTNGDTWKDQLPDGLKLEDFIDDAVNGRGKSGERLFDKKMLLQDAQTEIILLSKMKCDITFIIPQIFNPYHDEIVNYLQQNFPNPVFSKFNFINSNQFIQNEISNTFNLSILRNRTLALKQIELGNKLILLDGIENKDLDAIRTLTWDQIGFLARHACDIERMVRNIPPEKRRLTFDDGLSNAPHKDIWEGSFVFIRYTDRALKMLSKLDKPLQIVLSSPEMLLRQPGGPSETPIPYPENEFENCVRLLERDRDELERKFHIHQQIVSNRDTCDLKIPGWTEAIDTHEEQILIRLGLRQNKRKNHDSEFDIDISDQFDVAPGIKDKFGIAQQIIEGDPFTPIVLHLSGTQVIWTIAKHSELLGLENFNGDTGNKAGHLAELITIFLIKDSGLTLRKPKAPPVNRGPVNFGQNILSSLPSWMTNKGQEVQKPSEFSRIDLHWHDSQTGELRKSEVDFIAEAKTFDDITGKPIKEIIIGEVKLSSHAVLSNTQKALQKHIVRGGRVINPGLPGIRTKTFAPTWRVIHIGAETFKDTTRFIPDAEQPSAPDLGHLREI